MTGLNQKREHHLVFSSSTVVPPLQGEGNPPLRFNFVSVSQGVAVITSMGDDPPPHINPQLPSQFEAPASSSSSPRMSPVGVHGCMPLDIELISFGYQCGSVPRRCKRVVNCSHLASAASNLATASQAESLNGSLTQHPHIEELCSLLVSELQSLAVRSSTTWRINSPLLSPSLSPTGPSSLHSSPSPPSSPASTAWSGTGSPPTAYLLPPSATSHQLGIMSSLALEDLPPTSRSLLLGGAHPPLDPHPQHSHSMQLLGGSGRGGQRDVRGGPNWNGSLQPLLSGADPNSSLPPGTDTPSTAGSILLAALPASLAKQELAHGTWQVEADTEGCAGGELRRSSCQDLCTTESRSERLSEVVSNAGPSQHKAGSSELSSVMPTSANAGRTTRTLRIAIGCRDGTSVSVSVVEHLAKQLHMRGLPAVTKHRELDRKRRARRKQQGSEEREAESEGPEGSGRKL